ncbi:unnamed protein product [Alopecurus aequalis]
MAAALRFAARKICGAAFRRPHQAYFTAAADAAATEQYRRVFPKISHVRNSFRRFSSLESSNNVNITKHGFSSSITNNSERNPWWSIYHPQFVRNAFLVTMGICFEGAAIFYLEARFYGASMLRKRLGLDAEPRKQDD